MQNEDHALREAIDKASAETARLQRELDITNADHIALWLEANTIPDEPMSQCISWLACRIVEAHEAALKSPSHMERVAFAIIEGSAGTRAAEHAKEFQTANWTDACHSARAVLALPSIARQVATPNASKIKPGEPIQAPESITPSALVEEAIGALEQAWAHATMMRNAAKLVGPREYENDPKALKVWQRSLYHAGKELHEKLKPWRATLAKLKEGRA